MNFYKEVHQFVGQNKEQIINDNPSLRPSESLNFGTSHLGLYHPMDKKKGMNPQTHSPYPLAMGFIGNYSPKK
jgi:hypothetical protein